MVGEDYDMELVEIHHNKKKDAPSGTALHLAESLAKGRDWKLDDVACFARKGMIGERPKRELGIQTVRGGDVTGIHTIYFLGQGERIEIAHHAHSRQCFAQGALRVARWISVQKPGKLYAMKDMLA
jgi:4-hydroxy-tetrahydrodipicolinate reductase